ncbi:MAG: hypothetical protein R3213_01475 [Flavobacteriaceae bacterium]|nr:hypothetical protein [Flavobacteriaceae bacterium]
MGLHKILKILALLLSVAGIIFLVMIIATGDDAIKAGDDGSVDLLAYVAYAVLFIILVMVLIFVLKGLFSGSIKKTLISVGLFLGIFVVAYFLASGDGNTYFYNNQPATETESHWVGTGLIAFYIFALAAIGSMLFAGARKLTR